MNTPEGRKKGVETIIREKGADFYAKIGAMGGKNSPNRPMKDTTYAKRLANIRWTKYKYEKGQITYEEYKEIMESLGVSEANM